MRVLLSTIGSRGEVQPVVAVALKLRELGHEAVACAPPDFGRWAQSLGIEYVPVGPFVQGTAKPAARRVPSEAERQTMIDDTVATRRRSSERGHGRRRQRGQRAIRPTPGR